MRSRMLFSSLLGRSALILSTLSITAPAWAVVPPSQASKAWLRLDTTPENPRFNRQQTKLAFLGPQGQGLRILELKTKKIIAVSDAKVGPSFTWSPDGTRLFYRELLRGKQKGVEVESHVLAYDTRLNKKIPIATLPSSSGFLTLDPRDLRLQLVHAKGTLSRRLDFPDVRAARWQKRTEVERSRWLVTQKAVLHVTEAGFKWEALQDDGSGIESFDISPDGSAIAWATQAGNIYVQKNHGKVQLLAAGRDPAWHPYQPLIVFAGARQIGGKTVDTELRLMDLNGTSRWLTKSPGQERWPRWLKDGQGLAFTQENTTDLFYTDVTL